MGAAEGSPYKTNQGGGVMPLFEVWRLGFLWSLALGVWSLPFTVQKGGP